MFEILRIVAGIAGIGAFVAYVLLLISSFKRHVLWGLGVFLVPFAIPVYGVKYWREVKKPFLAYMISSTIVLGICIYFFMMMGGMAAINMAQQMQSGEMTEQDAAKFMMQTMEGIENVTGEGTEDLIRQMEQDPNITPEEVEQARELMRQMEALSKEEIQSLEEGHEKSAVKKDTAEQDVTEQMETEPDDYEVASARMDALIEEEYNNLLKDAPAPVVTKKAKPKRYELKDEFVNIPISQVRDNLGEFLYITTKNGAERKGTLLRIKGDELVIKYDLNIGTMSFDLDIKDIVSIKRENY